MPRVHEIQQMVHELDKLARTNFAVQEVNQLFKSHPLSVQAYQPYRLFSDHSYTRNLIHRTPDFELVLLCWNPGQSAPIHGHEGQKCWMQVYEGTLHFENYMDQSKSSALKLVSEKIGTPGFLDGPAYIHSVTNKSNEPAVSLHLYAHPIDVCDVYDNTYHKCRKNLSYYSREGKIL